MRWWGEAFFPTRRSTAHFKLLLLTLHTRGLNTRGPPTVPPPPLRLTSVFRVSPTHPPSSHVQVVKLGIQTCLLEPDEGERPSGTGITCSTTATANSSGTCPSGTMSGGNNNSSNGCGCGGSSSSSSVFLESGAGSRAGVGEQALPFGAASVLWELECCAAQALITLMNLNEGRPNHFGVFRASVYVEEIRMLEAKVGKAFRLVVACVGLCAPLLFFCLRRLLVQDVCACCY